ncbi:hypothetical protein AURDEDRAFT_39213, partial [Auricularia subglabra TFB-10046 SS5]
PNDISEELLRQTVNLLAHIHNESLPTRIPTPGHELPSSALSRINAYWFLSLTLSLSAALMGILCKQWVREYERDAGQSHRVSLGVRHVKHQGFEAWGVGSIVSSIPLVLQLALALFMIGILELLWRLHVIVAVLVTILAGITASVYIVTALLPLFQCLNISRRWYSESQNRSYADPWPPALTTPQCPYKSPQAWL